MMLCGAGRTPRYALLMLLCAAPVLAAEPEGELPTYTVLNSLNGTSVVIDLPRGTLKQEGNAFTVVAWDPVAVPLLLQRPVNLWQRSGAYSPEFLLVHGLFSDSAPARLDDLLLQGRLQTTVPPAGDGTDGAGATPPVALDANAAADAFAGTSGCELGEALPAGLPDPALVCLLEALRQDQSSAVGLRVNIGGGASDRAVGRAAVVIMREQEYSRRAYCASGPTEVPSADHCTRPIIALLVRDQPTLDALKEHGRAIVIGNEELEPKTAPKLPIRVIDLLDPDGMVLALLRDRLPVEAGAPKGPLVLAAVADTGAPGRVADPTAAALFTDEVLIRYETALALDRHGLVVPLFSGDVASGMSTDRLSKIAGTDLLTRRALIRDAFLPVHRGVAVTADPIVAIIPSWLYSRLRSTSLNAVAEKQAFCGLRDSENLDRTAMLTFATGAFDVEAGFAAFQQFPLNNGARGFAGNTQLSSLYQTSCSLANSAASQTLNALPASLTSAFNADVCALPRDDLPEDPNGVGPNALALPTVLDPLSGEQNPFLLVDRTDGVFVQARPVSLGDWDAFLGSFEGCRAALGTAESYSGHLVTCEPFGQGQGHPRPSGKPDNPEDEQAIQRNRAFLYYYQVITRSIDKRVGGGPRSLSCLGPTPSPDDPYCALRMYLASRAVDMVDMMSAKDRAEWQADGVIDGFAAPDTSNAAKDTAGDDSIKGIFDELRRSAGWDRQGDSLPAVFNTCGDAAAASFHPRAIQLCLALDRYVNAAFEGEWRKMPATMIPAEDAQEYLAWLVERQGNSDACKKQLGLPSAGQLAAGLVDEATVRAALVANGIARLDGTEAERMVASLKAGLFSPHAGGGTIRDAEIPSIAGIPAGPRQLVVDPAPAVERDTDRAHDRGAVPAKVATLGLSPIGMLERAQEEADLGFSDPSTEAIAWHRIWGGALDDPARSRRPREADPVTGFRLRLLVGGDDTMLGEEPEQ